MKIDLTGKTVVLTGASRGIGRTICRYLGMAGATVGIHYNKSRSEAIALSKEIKSPTKIFQADLEDTENCLNLFLSFEKEFEKIDVLINNAGIAVDSPIEIPAKKWLKDWEQTIKVNLTATALLCKAAINHFIQNGGGIIINISSRSAFRGETNEYFAYAASKGGMISLTRSIARGFGKQGVKAFNIAPGFVRTDMTKEFFNIHGEGIATDDIALPSLTEPQDIAPMIIMLCSGLVDHATGSTFDFNAGSYLH